MENWTIPVEQLLLDVENPRHERVQTQRQAIDAVLEEQGVKLVNLAKDIAARGPSPIDRMLVVKNRGGRTYTVLEGNRRITAIKLLHNADLAAGSPYEKEFRNLSGGAGVPDEVDCAVAPSRDDARHWLELRHTGEADGVGVVRWGALQANRFRQRPGSQASKAIAFIEAVRPAYPENADIQELLTKVASERLTTLGRVVADPAFKGLVGLVDTTDGMTFHFPAGALESLIEQLLDDIAGEYSVTKLKSKDQRAEYLEGLRAPNHRQHLSEAEPLVATSARSRTPRKRASRTRPSKPGPVLKDLSLENLGEKVQAILVELRQLDLARFPNAAAVLLRAVIELAVDEYLVTKHLTMQGEMKKRVKRCLQALDPTGKARQYQGVRTGLDDGTSYLAIATLHGFVHNPDFHPTASDLRRFANNFEPFLQGLNDGAA
jgi:hypothetical protein